MSAHPQNRVDVIPLSKTGGKLHDLRSPLDNVGDRIGWPAGRVQTTDRGQPVPKYTVAQERGHGGTALVDRVYGHLGEVRHRSDQVE